MIVIDMDMPKNCTECPIFDHITGWCLISVEDCPIKCDIEDIKAEIKAEMRDYDGDYDFSMGKRCGLRYANGIIDKCIQEGDHE